MNPKLILGLLAACLLFVGGLCLTADAVPADNQPAASVEMLAAVPTPPPTATCPIDGSCRQCTPDQARHAKPDQACGISKSRRPLASLMAAAAAPAKRIAHRRAERRASRFG